MSPMKVCFIGFGRRAKTFIGELAAFSDVEVAAVCDPYEKIGALCPAYDNVQSMLQTERPDVVIDVTPPKFRFENILRCDKAGVPLICEKPLFFSKREEDILRGISISVYPAYQLQFDGSISKAFEIAKKIGIETAELSQRVSVTPLGWRDRKEIGLGGCLLDNGSHLVQLLVHNFGMPANVFSHLQGPKSGVERVASSIIVYPQFICRLHTAWTSPIGKETRIALTGKNEEVCFLETNEGVRLWKSGLTHAGDWSARKEQYIYERRGLERDIRRNPFNQTRHNPTRQMLRAFFDDAKKGASAPSTYAQSLFETALLTSRVIHKLYESGRRGKALTA